MIALPFTWPSIARNACPATRPVILVVEASLGPFRLLPASWPSAATCPCSQRPIAFSLAASATGLSPAVAILMAQTFSRLAEALAFAVNASEEVACVAVEGPCKNATSTGRRLSALLTLASLATSSD